MAVASAKKLNLNLSFSTNLPKVASVMVLSKSSYCGLWGYIFSRLITALCIYFADYNMGGARPLIDMLTTEWDSVYYLHLVDRGG